MPTAIGEPSIKAVGINGQISLGKQYAGRHVLIEQCEPGVWLVRTATVVPDNERWLHEPKVAADLRQAVAWSSSHPASDDGTDAVLGQLTDGRR
jgi:hypothetical protein